MMPEVSVIIPTYNRRAMVHDAVTSVLAQRNASFELIVVDDGSTDGTRESLALLDGVTIARTEHRGPAAARNHGVAIAHAPLIAFDQMEPPPSIECQDVLHRQQSAGGRAACHAAKPRGPAGQPDQPKHRDQCDDDGED